MACNLIYPVCFLFNIAYASFIAVCYSAFCHTVCQWKPARGFLWHMGHSAPSDSFIKLSNMNQITKLCILFYCFPVFPPSLNPWENLIYISSSQLKKKSNPSVGPMDSLKPGQCWLYADVLESPEKCELQETGLGDKGPDGLHIQVLTLYYLLGVCISVSSWALGVSLRELPYDSGIAFRNSWKNERTIRHPSPTSQLKKRRGVPETSQCLCISSWGETPVWASRTGPAGEGWAEAPPWHRARGTTQPRSPWDQPGEESTVGLQSTGWSQQKLP